MRTAVTNTPGGGGGGHFKINGNLYTGERKGNENETKKNIKKTGRNKGREKGRKGGRDREMQGEGKGI
jgi:hypothetical protein